jgi:hypothetical protein
MGGACGWHGRDGKRIQILVGIFERRGTLGRPMRRCEYSIKVVIKEI